MQHHTNHLVNTMWSQMREMGWDLPKLGCRMKHANPPVKAHLDAIHFDIVKMPVNVLPGKKFYMDLSQYEPLTRMIVLLIINQIMVNE